MANMQDSPKIAKDDLEGRKPELIASDPRDRLIGNLEALLRDSDDLSTFLDSVIDCQEVALGRSSFLKDGDSASAAMRVIDRLRDATREGRTPMIISNARSAVPLAVALLAAASAIALWFFQAQILAFAGALLGFGSLTTWIHREIVARLQDHQAVPGWLRVMERFRSYFADEDIETMLQDVNPRHGATSAGSSVKGL